MRGRVLLAGLAPGAPQLWAGRRWAGGLLLTCWVCLVGILIVRAPQVIAAATGDWDERLAVGVLLAGILAVWTGSLADASGKLPSWGHRSGWTLTAGRLRSDPSALLGLVTILGFFLVAALAPLISPYEPELQADLVRDRLLPPSAVHPLGTDQFARDVLSRILYGARVSLGIGVVAVTMSVTLGTLLGALAGYAGGKVDGAVMRLVDVVISFPRLVLLITVVAFFEPSLLLVVLVLGLTQWPQTARMVRGEVLGLREREFVLAARALGYSGTRVVLRHLVPNALAPVIVAATLGVGNTIVLEAGLSFLGLGVQPPTPSWGSMVADGRSVLLGSWWLSTFPGLAIVLCVLGFNLMGEGLRDALDPRGRR